MFISLHRCSYHTVNNRQMNTDTPLTAPRPFFMYMTANKPALIFDSYFNLAVIKQ